MSTSQTRRCRLIPHTPDSRQHGETERRSCCEYCTEMKRNGCAQAPERGFLNRQWKLPGLPEIGWWNLCSGDRQPRPDARWRSPHLPPGCAHSWRASPPRDRQLLAPLPVRGFAQRTHWSPGPWPLTSCPCPQLEQESGRSPSHGAFQKSLEAGARAQTEQCLVQAGMHSRPTPGDGARGEGRGTGPCRRGSCVSPPAHVPLCGAHRGALHADVLMAPQMEGGCARGNAPSVAGAGFPELREEAPI